MNVFVEELAKGEVKRTANAPGYRVVVEDNVGESIHIHIWQLRLDMTIKDFKTLAGNVIRAKERLTWA